MGVSSSPCFKGEVHEMRLCVVVLLYISASYGRGVVDILRMDERDDYMSDVEEADDGVACDSCCEVPEDDTCGGILTKLEENQSCHRKYLYRRRARGGRWLDRGM